MSLLEGRIEDIQRNSSDASSDDEEFFDARGKKLSTAMPCLNSDVQAHCKLKGLSSLVYATTGFPTIELKLKPPTLHIMMEIFCKTHCFPCTLKG